jgi:tRNA (cytidine/uridine-2'-O-)-methyltransferase
MLEVALYQPSIPPNTGNIARQCVGMGARLHLIGPLGFDVGEKSLKRAGLDYWEHLELMEHETPEAFLDWLGKRRCWLISKKGKLRYDQCDYRDGDVLIFGNEIKGLPQSWHDRWPESIAHIPILGNVRSYNLSNAVALVLAHACSQVGLFD